MLDDLYGKWGKKARNQQKIQKPLAIEVNIQYSDGKKKDAHPMEELS